MPRPWYILLRSHVRRVTVALGICFVLLSSMDLNCLTVRDDAGDVTSTALPYATPADDAGQRDPLDPDGCGHCHCVVPSAIIEGHGVIIPVPLVSRNRPMLHPDDPPAGVTFAPDPPPNRA